MDDNTRDVRPVRPDDAEQLRPLLGKGTHHLPGLEMFLRPLPGDEGYLPDAFVAVTATGEVIGYAELAERRNTAELHEPVLLRGHSDQQLEQALWRALELEAQRRGLRVVFPSGRRPRRSFRLPWPWIAVGMIGTFILALFVFGWYLRLTATELP